MASQPGITMIVMPPDIIGSMTDLSRKISVACLLVITLYLAGCRQAITVPDFKNIQDPEEKKMRFFSFMSPVIREENERVLKQRKKLLGLYEQTQKGASLWLWDRRWLERLMSEYEVEVKGQDDPYKWQVLLTRVDIVPADLALIQAAKESAWGSSRFVREGNNMFGEHCFDEGCGIVPGERDPGAEHEVEVFQSVTESVRSYIHNLNTHAAYSKVRRLRSRFRGQGRAPDGYSLAETLPLYSERREAYIIEIRQMIRANRDLMSL